MVRKVAALLAFIAALAAAAFVAPSGGMTIAGGVCSPGQHGNPQPGFKPGVCDNK